MHENNGGFPTYTARSTSRSRLVFFFVILFLLVAVVLGGLYMLGSSQNSSSKKNLEVGIFPPATPTISVTPLPTSSVSAVLTPVLTRGVLPTGGISSVDRETKLDRSKLAVVVLNGSGTTGVAREVSDYLEGLGYRIVRVDNADAFTYSNLTVRVKESKSSYAGLLRKDLQANPDFAASNAASAIVSASVSDDIANEAEVIVGK